MKLHTMCLIAALGVVSMSALNAQSKIGFINSEAIVQQLPEAQDAQKQLDALTAEWQNDLKKMQDTLQQKFEDYDKRKLIMSDKRRADMEKELQQLDQQMVDYRTKRFGTNGDLFQKQNELMKPVQDRIFKAVQDVANEGGYDYVFDKSSSTLLMYANDKNDLTAKVLAKLQQK